MKGFKITINDEYLVAASSELGVTVAMDIDYIIITGLNRTDHLHWLYKELKPGDNVKILATEINEISPIKERKPRDRKDLKDNYERLKKELKDQGLI